MTSAVPTAGGPPRVLIVDDEVNLRRVLAAILAREGYEVLQASDGREVGSPGTELEFAL